jgi:hypothetical protein
MIHTIYLGVASKKWDPTGNLGAADLDTRKLYCHEMRLHFLELKLCVLDWKAEQIATNDYPSWHGTWSKQPQTMKQEQEGSPTPGDISCNFSSGFNSISAASI